jgi:hypothetical protein
MERRSPKNIGAGAAEREKMQSIRSKIRVMEWLIHR